LNIGPAIVAVIAISPNTFLVIAVSALISPRLFPQARKVNDNKAYGSFVIKPNNFSKSTTQFEVQLIQAILEQNAANAKISKRILGG
jgi:hypothetical protein